MECVFSSLWFDNQPFELTQALILGVCNRQIGRIYGCFNSVGLLIEKS